MNCFCHQAWLEAPYEAMADFDYELETQMARIEDNRTHFARWLARHEFDYELSERLGVEVITSESAFARGEYGPLIGQWAREFAEQILIKELEKEFA